MPEPALHEKIDATLRETEADTSPRNRAPDGGPASTPDLPHPPPRHTPDTQAVEGEDAINPPPAYYGGQRGDVQG